MKTQHNHKSHKGFTLIEMLGVLAIIAILISVIAVGVLAAINRARVIATVATLKNLETAVIGFVALPQAGGTVPLTSGAASVDIWDSSAKTVAKAAGDNTYTLDQPLRASGLIDRPISWRVGSDGSSRLSQINERIFMTSRNAWAKDEQVVNGVTAPKTADANDWSTYNSAFVAVALSSGVKLVITGDIDQLVTEDTDGKVTAINFSLDGQTLQRGSRVSFVILRNVSQKDANKLSAELNGALDDSEESPTQQLRGRLIYQFGTSGTAPVPTASTSVFYCLNAF